MQPKPTLGRVVRYFDSNIEERAAIVCYVHSEKCVNLLVINHNGTTYGVTSSLLLEPVEGVEKDQRYKWSWPVFEKPGSVALKETSS